MKALHAWALLLVALTGISLSAKVTVNVSSGRGSAIKPQFSVTLLKSHGICSVKDGKKSCYDKQLSLGYQSADKTDFKFDTFGSFKSFNVIRWREDDPATHRPVFCKAYVQANVAGDATVEFTQGCKVSISDSRGSAIGLSSYRWDDAQKQWKNIVSGASDVPGLYKAETDPSAYSAGNW